MQQQPRICGTACTAAVQSYVRDILLVFRSVEQYIAQLFRMSFTRKVHGFVACRFERTNRNFKLVFPGHHSCMNLAEFLSHPTRIAEFSIHFCWMKNTNTIGTSALLQSQRSQMVILKLFLVRLRVRKPSV